MDAIEIRDLSKSFRGMYAVDHLNMTVPVGAIYGFIGENGSGKSTTEKLICGHLVPNGGDIKLFGKDYRDAGVRVGALIENAGCFPSSSVWDNQMMQAINLGLADRSGEINRVLKIVRMEDSAQLKFKKCSLGMLCKIFLMAVFVAIDVMLSAAAKQKTWMALIGAFCVGMLLFMMIPIITPLDATITNVIVCLVAGALFSLDLGAVSSLILGKTSLV